MHSRWVSQNHVASACSAVALVFMCFFFFFLKKWSFFAFSPMSESVFIKWLLLFNFRAVVSKDIYKHQIEAVS